MIRSQITHKKWQGLRLRAEGIIDSINFRCEPYRDIEGNQLGPYRVWLADEDIPGLAMSRSFGDIVASQAGVICEPGNFKDFIIRNFFIRN